MELSIIVAMTRNHVIGENGRIPWRIPEDVELFKELTIGNTVIMGKNTWFSIPDRFRPLKDRTNIVVSSTMREQGNVIVCKDVEQAIKKAKEVNKKVFCIGGAKLYSTMLPLSNELHISWIKKEYTGDAYFSEINFSEWNQIESKEFQEFRYTKYGRKIFNKKVIL